MRTRRLVTAVLGVASALVSAAACTDLDGLAGVGSAQEAGSEAASVVEGGGDDGSVSDGATVEASTRLDGEAPIDPASCDGSCDCDKDGFRNSAEACGDAGPVDCDDTDKLRHPAQGFVADPPVGHSGDWNCDLAVTKAYQANVDCSALSANAGCTNAQGFETDPVCGASGMYVTCKVEGLIGLGRCVVSTKQARIQACK